MKSGALGLGSTLEGRDGPGPRGREWLTPVDYSTTSFLSLHLYLMAYATLPVLTQASVI